MANKTLTVPTPLSTHFFRYWLEFIRPTHGLTNNGILVLDAFLKKRHQLSKEIKSEELLDKTLFSVEVKKEIKDSLSMTDSNFYMVLCTLKKKGIIVDKKINPTFIPKVTDEDKEFVLTIKFNLSDSK